MASNDETEPQGWQFGKSLAECLRHMLENQVACDVTFSVQSMGSPHVNIPAHKLILQARSPVFEAMFSGGFMEASEDVFITDMEPEPFQDLLRYIYTDIIVLNGDNVIPLLYAGEKYILGDLIGKCKEFLNKNISVDNVCSVLTHSLIKQDEELVNTCLDLIAPNAKAVVKTEAFVKMSHDALLKVVGYDHLARGVEADLFQGCIEWGRRRTKNPESATDEEIRDILGTECLHKIRFPFIPFQEFGAKFGHSSVITEHEKYILYSLLATKEESFSKAFYDLGFDVSSRMIKANRYEYIYVGLHKMSGEVIEKFKFTVNKPIQLRGLSICGGLKGSEHMVKISIHTATGEENPCVQVEQKVTARENYKPIPVYFRKLRVNVNEEYRVCVSVGGETTTACSWKLIEQLEEGNVTITSKSVKRALKYRNEDASPVAEFLFQLLPAHDLMQ